MTGASATMADAGLLHEVAREVGTPTYVYDADRIRARFHQFSGAFGAADPLIAYAVKANSNLAIIGLLAGLGAGADIVSGGELLRAIRAGVPSDRIIFSGVGKSEAELRSAIAKDIFQVTLESVEEARELSGLAAAAGRTVKVGLRVTPGIAGGGGHLKISTGCASTKFGVPIGDALAAWAGIAGLPGLSLQGVAIHIGSQMLDLGPLRQALVQLDRLIGELRARGHAVRAVSVGGGLGVAYRGSDRPPPLEDYSRLVLDHASRWDARLILEPGRWLVAGAGQLLTRVIRAKQTQEKSFLVVDAAMNDLARPSLYDSWHRIELVGAGSGDRNQPCDIVGPICETSDIFGRDRLLPGAARGDLLAIADAGAYGSSMAGNYNSRPLPAEVLIEKGAWRVVRRRQSLGELLDLECELGRGAAAAE